MKKILILEPHSDDSCISSGGFLYKYQNDYEYYFRMYFSSSMILRHANRVVSTKERIAEYKDYATSFNHSYYIDKEVFDCEAKSDTIPMSKIVTSIENDISEIDPDILILQGDSYHQDHHIFYKACLAALRPCGINYPSCILIAENSTYVHKDPTNNQLDPNYYVSLTEEQVQNKIDRFRTKFPSQVRPNHNYLSGKGLLDWARYRGIEARCEYAEGFYLYYNRI